MKRSRVSSRRSTIFFRAILSSLFACFSLGAFADVISGNGKAVTERRELPAFSAVSIGGSAELKIHRGPQKVEISCDSNLLPYVTTYVSGGELTIGFKLLASFRRSENILVEIWIPSLSGFRQSGSGDAVIDAFSGDAFSGTVSGSGSLRAAGLEYARTSLAFSGSADLEAKTKARSLELRCSGSGALRLSGSADSSDISISGSAKIRGRELETGETRIVISGSGDAELRALRSLDASISGSGSIRYWGSPSISQRVSGSGRITRGGE